MNLTSPQPSYIPSPSLLAIFNFCNNIRSGLGQRRIVKTVSRVTVVSGLTDVTRRFRGRLCLHLQGGRCRWRQYACTKHCYTPCRLCSVTVHKTAAQTLAELTIYLFRYTEQFPEHLQQLLSHLKNSLLFHVTQKLQFYFPSQRIIS
jgi:hypothetical protein